MSPASITSLRISRSRVYVAWGSTYLAIRIGVAHVPPTVLAGVRFLSRAPACCSRSGSTGRRVRSRPRASSARSRSSAAPHAARRQRRRRWAEQTVPSGFAALIVATVPLWMAALAALPPPRERLPARAVVGIALGFVGVAVLVAPAERGGRTAARARGLLLSSLSWSCRLALRAPRHRGHRSAGRDRLGDALRRRALSRDRRRCRALRRDASGRGRRSPRSSISSRRARGSASPPTSGCSPTCPRRRSRPTRT